MHYQFALPFSEESVKNQFSDSVFKNAAKLVQNNCAYFEFMTDEIFGFVLDNKREESCKFSQDLSQGECSCKKYPECVHTAAVMLKVCRWIQGQSKKIIKNSINPNQSLLSIRSTLNAYHNPQKIEEEDFLSLSFYSPLSGFRTKLFNTFIVGVTQRKKTDGYRKHKKYTRYDILAARVTHLDVKVASLLRGIMGQGSYYGNTSQESSDIAHSDYLELFVKNALVFVNDDFSQPVKWGETINPYWHWEYEDGTFQLSVKNSGSDLALIALEKGFAYYHSGKNQMGVLDTNIPNELLISLVDQEFSVEEIRELVKDLEFWPELNLPTFHAIEISQEIIKPVPVLSLKTCPSKEIDWRIYNESIPIFKLEFNYDSQSVSWNNSDKSISFYDDGVIRSIDRDIEFEKLLIDTLWKHHVRPLSFFTEFSVSSSYQDFFAHDSVLTEEKDDFYQNIMETLIPTLEKLGVQVVVDNSWIYHQTIRINENNWYEDISESDDKNWFNVELGIEVNGEKQSLIPILSKLVRKKNWREINKSIEADGETKVEISPGKYLVIENKRLRDIVGILTYLFDSKSEKSDRVKVSKFDLEISNFLQGKKSNIQKNIFSIIEALKNLAKGKQKNIKPAKNMQATLRDYQLEGLTYLTTCHKNEFGSILADDMGLGKTIQTLAHLQKLYNQKKLDKRPSLVVCPTSLLGNWRQEIEKFTPDLKVLLYYGQGRKTHDDSFKDYQIVLTTYSLLNRDFKKHINENYRVLVLDEAQKIKNNSAQASRVCKAINSEQRIALTGTPMENHLGELWSIMDFVVPGLLGDEKLFQRAFRTPIEKHQNEEQMKRLKAKIKPFLLRRTKEEVAKDLPQKSEFVVNVSLDNKQSDAYETIRSAMESKVQKLLSQKGLSRSHIEVLEALLRLRQVCCDPRLLNQEQLHGVPSAKLDYLKEHIPDMVEEGRKILVFSQFTSMLELIEKELKLLGIKMSVLTGQTRKREEVIRRFQDGETDVFLISLKAGGVGLNLTAADTVIHYDPWWNPAVENQATDRAYRIGQDKPVFVYKLIAEKTVEEKILKLQEKKKALFDSAVSEGKGTFKLSEDDIKMLFEKS